MEKRRSACAQPPPYRLHQQVPVIVIEARDRVGRCVLRLRDAFGSGLTAELGGRVGFIDTEHTTIRSLASELNLHTVALVALRQGLTAETYVFDRR